ncbi:MAG: hypothetical protein HFI92_08405 [Lachnospiraceae bacterium]|nr:hypothetical protein [Lachnospiraceae bacterium]
MDEQFRKVDEQFRKVDEQFRKVEERLDKLEKEVSDLKLTIENEIRVNIKRVAEGHLDLSRNLHEALKIDNEKEMMALRINSLENEVRRLKERRVRLHHYKG